MNTTGWVTFLITLIIREFIIKPQETNISLYNRIKNLWCFSSMSLLFNSFFLWHSKNISPVVIILRKEVDYVQLSFKKLNTKDTETSFICTYWKESKRDCKKKKKKRLAYGKIPQPNSTLRYPNFGSRVIYFFPSLIYLIHAGNILKVVCYVLGTVDTTENRDSQGPWLSDLDYSWQATIRGDIEMQQ